MIYIIILSVLAGILGFYYLFLKNINFFKEHQVPYMTPLPILGNMGSIFLRRISLAEFTKNVYNMHSDAKYVGIYDFTKPIIVLRDPELIKSIALKHFDMFMDHRIMVTEEQDILFGRNLFSLNGERWRNVRTLLTPAFTSSKMRNMFELMSDYGIEFANFLAQMSSKKRIIETKDAFTKYTMDIIATCAFGINVDSMRNPENQFYVYGKEAASINILLLLKFQIFRTLPWLAQMLRIKLIRDEIVNFFKDLVKSIIETREKSGITRPDMLQLMMDCRNEKYKIELTIEDMVSQAFIFFFGGFESTSTSMCFVAHELAVNADIQERLQNEIDQVLEDTNGEVSYDALMGMEYLEAVINEALRLYPVFASVDRVCVKDFELPPTLPGAKPLNLKKGDILWIPFFGLQHDSKYFEEPEKFDPERFLGDRKKKSLNCGAYLPFGLGPRMCIGNKFALMEMKILFFHLLARCDLKVCEKTQIPIKAFKKSSINTLLEGGFWLSVVPRKNPHHTVYGAHKF